METSLASEDRVSGPGHALVIFVLFFGIALLEALRGGEWMRALFWLGIGVAFWLIERRGLRRRL